MPFDFDVFPNLIIKKMLQCNLCLCVWGGRRGIALCLYLLAKWAKLEI